MPSSSHFFLKSTDGLVQRRKCTILLINTLWSISNYGLIVVLKKHLYVLFTLNSHEWMPQTNLLENHWILNELPYGSRAKINECQIWRGHRQIPLLEGASVGASTKSWWQPWLNKRSPICSFLHYTHNAHKINRASIPRLWLPSCPFWLPKCICLLCVFALQHCNQH